MFTTFREATAGFKKSRFFRKTFFTCIFVSCALFFLFLFFIITMINTKYKENMTAVNDSQVLSTERTISEILEDVYLHTGTLVSNNAQVLRLLYGPPYDMNTKINSIDTLSSVKSSSRYIHSVYFINFNADYILTNHGAYTTDTFFDQELLGILAARTPSLSPVLFSPRLVNSYSRYSKEISAGKEEPVWSLIYYSNQAGAMVINIDAEALPTGGLTLLNRSGQVLASGGSLPFASEYSDPELLSMIQENPRSSGHLIHRRDGSRYTVSFSRESSLGLITIKEVPYSLIDTTNGLLTVTFFVSLAYLAACLVISCMASIILYRPIDTLTHSVISALPEPDAQEHSTGSPDEFTMLNSIYSNMLQKNVTLEQRMKTYKNDRKLKNLLHFIQGSSNAVTPAAYTEISMMFDRKDYMILIMSLDQVGHSTETPYETELLMYAISNVADELFTGHYTFCHMESSFSKLIYVLNFDEYNEILLKDCLEQLQDFITHHFKISFSVGASSVLHDMDDLSSARSEAESALNRRFIDGPGSLHFYSSLVLASEGGQRYPEDSEKEIINGMKHIAPDKTAAALDGFFARIRDYDYPRVVLYLMMLHCAIQEFEYANGLEPLPLEPDDITMFSRTLVEFSAMFQDRCLNAIAAVKASMSSTDEKARLIAKVEALVDSHIYDPNLSVIYLANEVGLSVNYLRGIYKERTGISLSSYINQKKLDLICGLLTTTDLSTQDISDRMGFTTKNYFFTFFKKNMDLTPTQYRKLHS